jgi:uncharacterized membrane protein
VQALAPVFCIVSLVLLLVLGVICVQGLFEVMLPDIISTIGGWISATSLAFLERKFTEAQGLCY